jgi:ABC-2 type transport system permease protein
MKKLKFLIAYGLKKRIFKKSFLISNLIIGLITLIIINIPLLIALFDSNEEKLFKIDMITDVETEALTPILEGALNQGFETSFFIINQVSTFDEETFFAQNDIDMVIILNRVNDVLSIKLYRFEVTYDQMIIQTLQYLDTLEQFESYQPARVELFLPENYEDPIIAEIVNSLAIVFVLPLFIIMVFGIQFVGVDIIEEKSSKAIETIISSVPANIHFLSKIISSIIFIMIQSSILLIFGFIGTLITRASQSASPVLGDSASLLSFVELYFPHWQSIIAFSIIFILVGSIFYLVFAALIAASSTTQEDYQQFQSPMMLILVLGFYISIFASAAQAYELLRIVSFIPLFSPLVVPVAYALGAVSVSDMLIALLITIVFTSVIIKIFTPMYKVAILSYDQTTFIKRVKAYFNKSKYIK